MSQKQIIEALDLSPHPEGGYYRETYRSKQKIILPDGSERMAGTGIYFLLTEGELSDWHRVRSDELWHFYHGDSLALEIISHRGEFRQLRLGNDFSDGVALQQLVPQNCWQRAYSTGRYSLVGCTVSPGFEFEDFEMIKASELAQQFPDIADSIKATPFSQ